jgi:glycogen synthase kinase 3 beta
VEIIKILGTPGADEIRSMNPHYKDHKFPQISAIPWQKLFKLNTNPEAVQFVSLLLVYDPKERPHPLEALEDTYFD